MENENTQIALFEHFSIEPIHEKYAWRMCDFVTINTKRLQRYFPKTLAANLNPTLSQIFVEEKVREYMKSEEFLFVLKDNESRALIGLVYIKELDWEKRQAELAYCIGYQYEGKGITSLAVDTLSKYAIKELGLKTLNIIAHKTNTGSVRVAEKCGYTWRKQLPKEHTPPNEAPLDMELYVLSV
ncbi:GNAT family N-acetyltransferase [Zobellia galactanivorans]|uniref:GNAT family N-acetyltransferase n=1 Tax=Zobellia galactanivorans (strain DSM 12802 / CCUG 47099 / CIP 106680 / NCIMB 13871 / Dsij) TaxID=63186 RepID=UPI001C07994B|nr:GNAT family N-acetyltransferase [Zobellia galactanivorans]MBU3026585.1 GNAT family N-acetyltransferase [Zobellia galactanivorans]